MSENIYKKLIVANGFVKGTIAGATVSVGVSEKLKVYIRVQAKTISSVYESIEKYQSEFSRETFEEIKKSKIGGGFGFFARLFGLIAGSEREYYNKLNKEDIQLEHDSQIASEAYDTASPSDVIIEGEVIATGVSNIPTEAYVYVNLTQVSIDDRTSLAVTDHPQAVVADINGDDSSHVKGNGTLNIVQMVDLDENNHPQTLGSTATATI